MRKASFLFTTAYSCYSDQFRLAQEKKRQDLYLIAFWSLKLAEIKTASSTALTRLIVRPARNEKEARTRGDLSTIRMHVRAENKSEEMGEARE